MRESESVPVRAIAATACSWRYEVGGAVEAPPGVALGLTHSHSPSSSGLQTKNLQPAGLWQYWLQRISARECGAGDEVIGRARRVRSTAQSKVITAQQRFQQCIGRLSVSLCPSASVSPAAPKRGPPRAEVEAHARAGMWQRHRANLGLRAREAPGRRERRLRGPWRWALEAWPRCC